MRDAGYAWDGQPACRDSPPSRPGLGEGGALTRAMAVEYGKKGIRVNCICPAGIATEMVKASSLDDPSFEAACFFKRAPLGHLGEPEEMANLAVFLASDESSYITGAIVRADGGTTVTPIS
jgi:NAD(P)-dependent dehydrogenase (short-subunit alcohol dehydrogenase family)